MCFLCLADAVRFLGWGTAAVPHASLAGCACLLMGSAVASAPFQPGHPAWAALASFGKQPVELDTDLGAAFSSRTLKRALKDKKVVRMFVVDRGEGAAVPCLGVVVECAGSDQAAREYCVHGGARIRGRCGWVPVECVRMVTFPQVGALGRTRLLFCGRARQAVAAHAYCALAPAAQADMGPGGGNRWPGAPGEAVAQVSARCGQQIRVTSATTAMSKAGTRPTPLTILCNV